MESLAGVVIVDGQFSVKQLSQDSLVISEDYSEKPLHIVFRAVAPNVSELDKMLAMRSTRLRVFGTVVKPYGKDGITSHCHLLDELHSDCPCKASLTARPRDT
jgi:hypothetical protein